MSFLGNFFRHHYQRLLQIRDSPHAIAGGLALGAFFGMTPLIGLKTGLALLTAWLTRCSKIAAVIAVTLHDVLIPIAPIVFRWQYIIGYWLLSHPHRLPKKIHFEEFHLDAFMHWRALRILWPTLVGSLVLAVPIAIVTYFVALRIVERAQARHAAHEQAAKKLPLEEPPQ
jgi:uncharacterized protein (DUF2062 family)